jgi:2-dehydropantoate 2-reductase
MQTDTRIAVIGLGAIGGWVAARLAARGCKVSAVARGETLKAVAERGLVLEEAGETRSFPLAVSDRAEELGPQDVVFISVKGQALAAASKSLAPLLGPDTVVVTMMNGVPWWFLAGRDDKPLHSVDPTGEVSVNVPLERVLGCVVHASCQAPAPGCIAHRNGNGLILGEPLGGLSPRLESVVALLNEAGFAATASEKIQFDIWYKLWGNMTMNPLSAITGATADKVLDDELVATFIRSVMAEAKAVGEKIGCAITETPLDRNAVTRKLGAFKTSMLQDVEAGRSIELDALVAAPREIAERVGVPTPYMDALLGVSRLFARQRGLYPL